MTSPATITNDPRIAELPDSIRRSLTPYLTRSVTLGEDFERAEREVDAIIEQYGENPDTMPAGQAQRLDNTKRRMKRLADELAEADADVDRRIAAATCAAESMRTGRGIERIGAGPDVHIQRHRDPWAGLGAGLDGDSPRGLRARAMDMAEYIPDVPQAARKRFAETVEKDTDPRSALSRWALAAGRDSYRSAFFKVLADPIKGHMLWDESERAAWADAEHVSRAVEVGTGPAGGYMVPYFLDPSVIITNDGAAGGIRNLVRNVVTTGTWHGVSSAGVTTEWLAEGAEAADASPTVDDPAVPLEKLSVFVPFSFEAEASISLLSSELQRLIMDAYEVEMSRVIVAGTGSGQPTGVVTALAGQAIPLGTAGTLAASDVYALQNALGPRYQSRAAFAANLATINQLAQMETPNGALQFPSIENDRLLRRVLAEDSTLSSVGGGGGGASLAYGDFQSGYVAATGVGTRIELAPMLFGPNGRPNGTRGYFLWTTVGGNVVDTNAIKLLAA